MYNAVMYNRRKISIVSYLVQWDHCSVSAEILVSSEILIDQAASSHYQVLGTLHGWTQSDHVTTKPYSTAR